MISKEVILYNVITATPTTQAEFKIDPKENGLILNINGTSTTRNISFTLKYSNDDTSPVLIQGYNPTTSTLASSTTGTGKEYWTFDGLKGFYSLVVNVSSLSGGNLTILGKGIMT